MPSEQELLSENDGAMRMSESVGERKTKFDHRRSCTSAITLLLPSWVLSHRCYRVMDNNSEFSVEEIFESAVSIVKNLPKEGPIKPSDDLKLKLYAYYKQATHGPNNTPKPRFYQIVEAYKWDAWHKLGNMSKHDAMLNYIKELKQIMDTIPNEEAAIEDSKHFEDILGKKFYDYCKSTVSYPPYQHVSYQPHETNPTIIIIYLINHF